MVAIAGLPLAVTLVSGWKSRPSLAMANRTRGIGNIEPSRLERQRKSSLQHPYADLSVLQQTFFADLLSQVDTILFI